MFGASLSRAGRAALPGSAVTTSWRWVSLRTFYAMIPVLTHAATAAVARLSTLVAWAALIDAVALIEAALVEAALVEAVVLVEVVVLVEAARVEAARVEAALVAGSICHRPPRNRQMSVSQSVFHSRFRLRFKIRITVAITYLGSRT